jgi:hypothetical protein
VWKGYLTFGLISVPVHLLAGARSASIDFHLIHEKCGSRIQMKTWCQKEDREVARRELVKGHEVEDGRYVLVDDKELKAIAPTSSKKARSRITKTKTFVFVGFLVPSCLGGKRRFGWVKVRAGRRRFRCGARRGNRGCRRGWGGR